MKPRTLAVGAIIAAALVATVYWHKKHMKAPVAPPAPVPPKKEGLSVSPRSRNAKTNYRRAAYTSPYTAIQNQIDEVRGNPDAKILMTDRAAISAYRRSQAEMTPEDIMHAERESWNAAAESDRRAPYNTEKMLEQSEDTMQHFESSPAIDYQTMVQDLVIDPRTRANHENWVQEMSGWNGTTTMKVDTLEPQLYLNWQGLRFPQAGVGQYNPLQLTEVDDSDLAVNKERGFTS